MFTQQWVEKFMGMGKPEVMNQTGDAFASGGKRQWKGTKKNPRLFTPELQQKAIQMRLDGVTYEKIGEAFNVNESTIRKALYGKVPMRQPKLTSEQWRHAQYLRDQGLGWRALGRMFGVSESCIRRRLDR